MLLRVDESFILHRKECDVLSDEDMGTIYVQCTCPIPRTLVNAKEIVCFLSKSNGIAYLVTQAGQVGGTRLSWSKKFIWRLNTVQIKNIREWNGEDISVALFLVALLLVGLVGAYALIKTATASGIVDSCIVKQSPGSNMYTGPMYVVEGHRSWRSDEDLFVSKVREEADAKMLQICPK